MENNASDLSLVYQAAMSAEHMAWDYLQHMRVAGSPAEREQYLQAWVAATRALRQAESQLTRQTVQLTANRMRQWLGSSPPEPDAASAGMPPVTAPAEQLGPVPRPGQKYRARDGGVWTVESVAIDQLDRGHFLAQIQRTDSGATRPSPMEAYGEDWPLLCLIYGLRLLPA
ncbi:MAG: hypothetical protein HYX47_22890 [Burkholderiales bacterium]|nr:hypothetical protein [Burkholderiales bacterium]